MILEKVFPNQYITKLTFKSFFRQHLFHYFNYVKIKVC